VERKELLPLVKGQEGETCLTVNGFGIGTGKRIVLGRGRMNPKGWGRERRGQGGWETVELKPFCRGEIGD